MKKLFALVFSLVLCVSMYAVPVSAATATPEESNRQVITVDVVSPMSVPASTAGYISGGYGTRSCTLTRHLTSGSIQAAVSSSTASGTVECWVIIPNGTYQYLGTVPASGGSTQKVPFYTLATGTYTFAFEATTDAQLYVSGYIYD